MPRSRLPYIESLSGLLLAYLLPSEGSILATVKRVRSLCSRRKAKRAHYFETGGVASRGLWRFFMSTLRKVRRIQLLRDWTVYPHSRATHWRRSMNGWCAGDLRMAEDRTVSNNDQQLVPEDVANVDSCQEDWPSSPDCSVWWTAQDQRTASVGVLPGVDVGATRSCYWLWWHLNDEIEFAPTCPGSVDLASAWTAGIMRERWCPSRNRSPLDARRREMRQQPPWVWQCWLLRRSQEHSVQHQKPVTIATVPPTGTLHCVHLFQSRCQCPLRITAIDIVPIHAVLRRRQTWNLSVHRCVEPYHFVSWWLPLERRVVGSLLSWAAFHWSKLVLRGHRGRHDRRVDRRCPFPDCGESPRSASAAGRPSAM